MGDPLLAADLFANKMASAFFSRSALPVLPLPAKSSPDKSLLAEVLMSQKGQDSCREATVNLTKAPVAFQKGAEPKGTN